MWSTLLTCVLYNPLHIVDAWRARAEDLAASLSFADIIVCPATTQRQRLKQAPTTLHTRTHTVYQFGWERGRHNNKIAGCAVFLKRAVRKTHVVEIAHPPSDLAGRRGLIHIHSGQFDVTVIVAYFPPVSNMKADHWRSACKRLASWVHSAIQQAKQRPLVVVGLDANCQFGRRRIGQGLVTSTQDGRHVGPYATGDENEVAAEIWRILEMESRSAPDYILIPAAALTVTKQCRVVRRSMEELQIILDSRPKDHAPLLWQAQCQLQEPTDQDSGGGAAWDREYLAKLLLHEGEGCTIIAELER
ncbi:unnamed protein product, partial [Prorocentrum cordatum]